MNSTSSVVEKAQESPIAVAATPPATRFLFGSRTADFWLLGGGGILLWIVFYFLHDRVSTVGAAGLAIPGVAYVLAYWVNHPHFMASYSLAYRQGQDFILGNWFQLILVPLLLVSVSVAAFLYWDTSMQGSPVVDAVNRFFTGIGWETRIGQHANLGQELLWLLVMLMYFTVGWHYSKQTYGCMMVYANFDGYRMTNFQRQLIRYALLSTWWTTWLYSNCSAGSYKFYELDVYRVGLPYVYFQVGYAISIILLLAMVALVFVKNYLQTRQEPSATMLVPCLALVLWHFPIFEQAQYFYMIAFFHSLQYLPFVAKIDKRGHEIKGKKHPWLRVGVFYGVLVLVGMCAFIWVPNWLDATNATQAGLGVSFFLICFLVFINVHHYFIDNVIWRFKNKQVKESLFA